MCFVNVVYLFYMWGARDSAVCYPPPKAERHVTKYRNGAISPNLLYNNDFAQNWVAWRHYGRYRLSHFSNGVTRATNKQHPIHMLAIYDGDFINATPDLPWNGVLQPVDLRDHTSFMGSGYYELRFDVDYINLSLKGNLNIKMRAVTKDFTPMDAHTTDNVFSVPNTDGSGNQLMNPKKGEVLSDAVSHFLREHQKDLHVLTSRASLVMYSKKPLNYVTCYIYPEVPGIVLISNTSLTVRHVDYKEDPSVKVNMQRFEKDDSAKLSEKIGDEFKLRDLMWEKRRVQPFYRQSTRHFNKKTDTTITAQLDVSRFSRLIELCKQWDGPMSVVIYIKEQKDIRDLNTLLEDRANMAALENVDIHLAHKRELNENLYPINELRNIAIELSKTEYIFTIDVDFVVSNGLNQHIKSHLQSTNYPVDVFFVVPAFELDGYSMENTKIFPKDKRELVSLLKQDKARQILAASFEEAHKPTDINKWIRAESTYEAIYSEHWEPFGVVHRSAIKYDERFAGYGWDKVSHIYYLHKLSFQFLVLPEAYTIHMEHATSTSWANRTTADKEWIFSSWFESITEFNFKYFPQYFNPIDMKNVATMNHDHNNNHWFDHKV
ncbi:hypothetical protein SAMD00019534_122610 [Acytostelium subglobosum LB1]|uniref:hypothetical protein n=1 Tax=Acytostelium subglobosum LB1 TaxID=1410327 RepID=UPI0006451DA6|nr:hypothetical protein SAMD00019534_122610 [Acytostelium subglobosum LB1]GAM29085.1 hypothetical protein SAMD00019534_122610 [Acytostelium subglobosum LB1]|eukprot:XP_012747930.1 hypothetical protein SAMD00019534_122610 [Acytostelium subglobosum LB1]